MDLLRAQLLSDPEIIAGMQLLLETFNVDSHLTFSDLQVIAGRLNGIFERGVSQVAVVVDSRYGYSLAKTFAVFAANAPVRMKPFRRRENALEWLKSGVYKTDDPSGDEPQSVVDRDSSLVETAQRRRTPGSPMRPAE
jgi:hypothetical protein